MAEAARMTSNLSSISAFLYKEQVFFSPTYYCRKRYLNILFWLRAHYTCPRDITIFIQYNSFGSFIPESSDNLAVPVRVCVIEFY